MKKEVLIALGLIVQFSFAAVAQQPSPTPLPPPPPAPSAQRPAAVAPPTTGDDEVVRISTNLVQVDAVVTDKSGKPINDLKQDEIQIFEDGRQQKITHFSFVVADSSPPAPAAKPIKPVDKNAPPAPPEPPSAVHPEQIRRTIALVVDDLGLSFQSIYFVRRALKKFVDEQMQPGDLVAIIRTSGGIGALQQFTAEKTRLYSAIDHLKYFAGGRSGTTPTAPMDDTSSQTDDMQTANADLDQFREDAFAVGTLGAVSYVVDGLRDLPGRKSILLISDGFKIYKRDDPTANLRALDALKNLVERASRASVVIYSMNASGLQTLGLTAADNTGGRSAAQIEQSLSDRRSSAFDSQEGLDYLAKQTGGLAIHNTNDLGGGIRKVMDDQKGYYLIGYRPDEASFDAKTGRSKFHQLTLKITRPGKYSYRTRNGFYGVTEEEIKTAEDTPQQRIIKALKSPFGSAGVHVHLTSLFANDPNLGSLMRSMLHVNAGDLTFTDEPDGWHQAGFDVVILTYGDNGVVVEPPTDRTYTLRVKGDEYERIRKEGFVYYMTVIVKKPGAYQLRAAVRDHGSDRVGSASQFVEVPDIKKNRLTLSGIVMTAVDPAALKKAEPQTSAAVGQAAPGQNSERQETGNARNSAAVRQFQSGAELDYGVVIYNARLDKTQAQPQLQVQVRVFHDGKAIFTGKEQPFVISGPTDLKRLGVSSGMQLGKEMAPGEYILQVIVTDLLADEKHRVATQWMDFEIVK